MPIFNAQYEYDFIDPDNLLTGLFAQRSRGKAPIIRPLINGVLRHRWYNADYDKLRDAAALKPM